MQISELLVGIEVDSKEGQARLLELEQQLGQMASRASALGRQFDDGFSTGVERSLDRAGTEFREFGDTAQSALRRASEGQSTLAERTEAAASKSAASAAKLEAQYERQRAVLDRNVIGLDRLEGGYRKNARALDQMERQAKEARTTLERMFREGVIDARRFEQQMGIVENSMREFRDASRSAGNQTFGQQMGSLALKVGGAVVAYQALSSAVRGTTRFMVGNVEAAKAQEDAENALASALERTGEQSGVLSGQLKLQASALQAASRYGDETTLRMQALGLEMGVGSWQIEKATQAAADMSVALGMTLEESMKNVAKTTGGYAGELGELIPELKELTKEQLQAGEGVDLLAAKFAGRAARDVQTFSGRVDQLRNNFGEAREELGSVITDNGSLQTAIAELSDELPGLAQELTPIVSLFASVGAGAVEVAAGLARVSVAAKLDIGGTAQEQASKYEGQIDTIKDVIASVYDLGNAESVTAAKRDEALSRFGLNTDALGIGWEDLQRASVEGGEAQEEVLTRLHQILKSTESQYQSTREKATSLARAMEEAAERARKEAEEARREEEAKRKAADAAKRAAEQARRLREEIAGVTGQAPRYAELAAEVKNVEVSTSQQLELLETIKSGAESAREALYRLWAEDKINLTTYSEELAVVESSLARIAEQEAALAAERTARATAAIDSLAGPDTKRTAGGAMGVDEDGRSGFQQYGDEQLVAAGESEQAQLEALSALVLQYGELDMARQMAAIAQEEAILRTEIETMALDGLTAAEEQHIATRLKSIEAMRQDAKASQHASQVKQALAQASRQSATAILQTAIDGSKASWKQLQEDMKAKAKGEAVNAAIELALGLGAAAVGSPSAAGHFASAKAHGIAAAMAGGTAVLAGAMGGGGEEKKDEAPRDRPGMETYRDVRESEREERGPKYEIAITGTLLGGQPEDMARQLQSYLSQFNEESGSARAVRG